MPWVLLLLLLLLLRAAAAAVAAAAAAAAAAVVVVEVVAAAKSEIVSAILIAGSVGGSGATQVLHSSATVGGCGICGGCIRGRGACLSLGLNRCRFRGSAKLRASVLSFAARGNLLRRCCIVNKLLPLLVSDPFLTTQLEPWFQQKSRGARPLLCRSSILLQEGPLM